MLSDNLQNVKKEIETACKKSGRNPEEVTLVAVSKTKPSAMIKELYDAGHRDFGENYVQELREKHEELPDDIRWHMIGHLQRNKVKYIAPFVYMIHAVDSLRLAETIDKEAAKCGRVIPILIEVNVGGEETKFGVTVEDAPALVEAVSRLEHIEYRGLMTSAPPVDDPEKDRGVFRALRQLGVDIKQKNLNNETGTLLSMGMSQDYRVAVEEGATHVRVGTDIFGARNYGKADQE